MSDSKKIDHIQERIDQVAETVSKIDKDVAVQQAALDAHTKQDEKMYEEFKRMNDTLCRLTATVEHHVHRSDTLEDLVQKIDARLAPLEIQYIQKAAVRSWLLSNAKLIGKIGGAIVAIATMWIYVKPWIEGLLSHL